MRVLGVVVAFVVLQSATPAHVQATSSRGTDVFTDELSAVTLRNPRAEVLGVYLTMHEGNWHDIYHRVSIEMQSDIWTIHLTRALVEIPDLSAEQRAVILQAIGLVATGALVV